MAELAEPVIQITLRALIFPFITLAGYFVAWGLVFYMDAVVRAFFGQASGLIGHIPIIGRTVSNGLLVIEHKLTSYLGGMEVQFENQMATRWHRFAGLIEQRNDNAMRGAVIVYHAVAKLNTLWGNWATGGLMKDTHTAAKHAGAQAAAVTKTAQHAAGVAHAGYQATSPAQTQTIPHTQVIVRTYPAGRLGTRTSALESAITGVIDYDLPGLRARDKAISDSLGRLWKRVNAERKTIGLGVFTGLLVAALGRLGIGWLRCRNVAKVGKRICGMNPSALEALLADTLAIVGTVSLIEFIRDAQAVEEVALNALGAFIREMPRA